MKRENVFGEFHRVPFRQNQFIGILHMHDLSEVIVSPLKIVVTTAKIDQHQVKRIRRHFHNYHKRCSLHPLIKGVSLYIYIFIYIVLRSIQLLYYTF